MSEIKISDVYKTVFRQGRGVRFGTPEESQVSTPTPFPDTPSGNDDDGTEFMNMRGTIKANTPMGVAVYMPVQIGDLVLPNEPTLTIRSGKIIQRTTIAGNTTRRGTVKELIYTDDYEITIRGVALNYQSSRVYPEDIVKALNDLYLENKAQPIRCAITEILGISEIVIDNIEFPHTPGMHAQAYEITCHSDEPFELDIDA